MVATNAEHGIVCHEATIPMFPPYNYYLCLFLFKIPIKV